MSNLKVVFLICVLFLLLSCQSNLQKLGEKHKTSIEKWYELAKFAESDLNSYKVKLLATYSLNIEQSNFYQLNDFRISVTESAFDMNLLTPSIEHKYLCDPVCKQLAELTNSENGKAGVLSDFYFDQSEFDLFKFYGDLYLLNETVINLKNYSHDLIDNYLLFLAKENQKFSNLTDFMDYLKHVLNEEAFYIFINDPGKRFKALSIAPTEAEQWSNSPLANLPVNKDEAPRESLLWNKELKNTDRVKGAINVFIGDIVCHGLTNVFGLVKEIQGRQVTVQLAGELRSHLDGILAVSKPNDILLQEGTIDFFSVEGKRQYLIDEIEKCNVFNPKSTSTD